MNVFFKWNKPNLSSKPCYRVSSHRPCIFFCVDLWRFFNKETKLCDLKKYTKTRTRIWDVCTFFILVSIYCLLSNNVRVFKCLILLLLKKKITSNLHGKIVQSILSYISHQYDKQMHKFNWNSSKHNDYV